MLRARQAMADARPEDLSDDALEEMVGRMRAKIRQRRAELAAEERCPLSGPLAPEAVDAELLAAARLAEPPCTSRKRWIGSLLVWLRLRVKKAFVSWYAEPILDQQTAFNLKVSRLGRDVAEELDRLYARIDALERKLARLSK